MWLFTPFGFFSAVRDKRTNESIVVRARIKRHLEQLLGQTGETATILETPDSDYRWRIFLSPEQWTKMAAELARQIDYCNFKSEAERRQRYHDDPYCGMLHDIWDLHAGIQQDGKGSRAKPWAGK